MRTLASLRQLGVNLQSAVAALTQQILLLYRMHVRKADPISLGITITNASEDTTRTASLFDVLGLNGLAANHSDITVSTTAFGGNYARLKAWLERYEIGIGGYRIEATESKAVFALAHTFYTADFDKGSDTFNLSQAFKEGKSANKDEDLVIVVNHFFMLDQEKGFVFTIPAGETITIDFNVLFTTRNYWMPLFFPKTK